MNERHALTALVRRWCSSRWAFCCGVSGGGACAGSVAIPITIVTTKVPTMIVANKPPIVELFFRGAPQLGQAVALLLICLPHSRHLTRAIGPVLGLAFSHAINHQPAFAT